MKLAQLGLLLALVGGSGRALAQGAAAPAPEPTRDAAPPRDAPSRDAAGSAAPSRDAPSRDAAGSAAAGPSDGKTTPEGRAAGIVLPPSPPEPSPAPPPPTPTPESAPAPEKTPESATPPENAGPAPGPGPLGRSQVVAPTSEAAPPEPEPWVRARTPLTLEARLGLLWRPESRGGFDSETHTGADLGLSLYLDLSRRLAAGLDIEHSSLGGGSALHGLDSVSIDYAVTSALLGFRAYPMRSDLIDVFVGIQAGAGVQSVSARGTLDSGAVTPPVVYTCSGSDAPAFEIGAGIGARLMLTPRWGVSARVNGMARRLTSEIVDGCSEGVGSATTMTAGLGLGYDFDLD